MLTGGGRYCVYYTLFSRMRDRPLFLPFGLHREIRVWCRQDLSRRALSLGIGSGAARQPAFARGISPILPSPRRLNLAQMFLNSDLGRQSGPWSCFAVRNPSGPKLLFGGTASSARGVVKTSAAQLYPMYLISVSDFLEEATLRPHQQLLVDCKLELHGAQHTGRVIYVSHREWRV